MTTLFAVIAATVAMLVGLPAGTEQVHWGMSAAELQKIVPAQKVELGHGYGYAEHTEQEPDVYAQKSDGQKHAEYYLASGKLYKIFIVYERALSTPETYAKLLAELKQRFGAPGRSYEDQVFGIRVVHNEWKDEISTLDLRMGAGFVYEVRYENAAAKAKEVMQHLKQSI